MFTYKQYFLLENQKLGDEREWNTDSEEAWNSVQEYVWGMEDGVSKKLNEEYPLFVENPEDIPLTYVGYLVGSYKNFATEELEIQKIMYFYEDPNTGKLYAYDVAAGVWAVIKFKKPQLLSFLKTGSRFSYL